MTGIQGLNKVTFAPNTTTISRKETPGIRPTHDSPGLEERVKRMTSTFPSPLKRTSQPLKTTKQAQEGFLQKIGSKLQIITQLFRRLFNKINGVSEVSTIYGEANSKRKLFVSTTTLKKNYRNPTASLSLSQPLKNSDPLTITQLEEAADFIYKDLKAGNDVVIHAPKREVLAVLILIAYHIKYNGTQDARWIVIKHNAKYPKLNISQSQSASLENFQKDISKKQRENETKRRREDLLHKRLNKRNATPKAQPYPPAD